jgi:hypothetical protein
MPIGHIAHRLLQIFVTLDADMKFLHIKSLLGATEVDSVEHPIKIAILLASTRLMVYLVGPRLLFDRMSASYRFQNLYRLPSLAQSD